MPIAGGCLRGQLRYEIAAEAPIVARICWCRVCQYLGAGNGTEPSWACIDEGLPQGERGELPPR